jgi:hypothetical protein
VQGRAALSLRDLEAFDPEAPQGGAQRRFACPLCDSRPRQGPRRALSLTVESGLWHCFRCGAGGRLREHWQPRLTGRAAALRAFGLHSAPQAPPAPPAQATATPPPPAKDWQSQIAGARAITDTPGARYLERRSISAEVAAAAGVEFSPDFYGRPAVLFPVVDQAGDLVAVTGRHMDACTPKAHTAGPKSRGVFVTPGALQASPLIVTEAPIDALSLAVCGFPAIAINGTSWPAWLPTAAAFRAVIVALDADAGGDEAAAKLTPALQAFGAKVERWRPSAGKDWNEALRTGGADALRFALFWALAPALYQDARTALADYYGGRAPHPHAALEQAIDQHDWPAFCREILVYVAEA